MVPLSQEMWSSSWVAELGADLAGPGALPVRQRENSGNPYGTGSQWNGLFSLRHDLVRLLGTGRYVRHICISRAMEPARLRVLSGMT